MTGESVCSLQLHVKGQRTLPLIEPDQVSVQIFPSPREQSKTVRSLYKYRIYWQIFMLVSRNRPVLVQTTLQSCTQSLRIKF